MTSNSRPKDRLNERETVEDLESCIANVERGIFALEMDVPNLEKHQAHLEQMYYLKRLYEKDLRALKKKKDVILDL